jgi:hypothetical protein
MVTFNFKNAKKTYCIHPRKSECSANAEIDAGIEVGVATKAPINGHSHHLNNNMEWQLPSLSNTP